MRCPTADGFLNTRSLLFNAQPFLSPHPLYRDMSNQDQRSTHPELERLNEDMKGFKLFDVPSSTEPRKRAFVDTERMQQTWKGPFMQKGYLYLAAASLQELQSRRLQALQSARLNAALPTAPHVNYSYGTTHGDAKVLRGFIADGEEYLWRTAAASESFLVSKDYSLFNRKKTVQELASTLQGKDAVSREAQWMGSSLFFWKPFFLTYFSGCV
jgi:hypothetical protein